jgi:hypothetical protein
MSSYEYLHISVKKLPKNAGAVRKSQNRPGTNILGAPRRQARYALRNRVPKRHEKEKNYSANGKMY